jgi:hypothetical protein
MGSLGYGYASIVLSPIGEAVTNYIFTDMEGTECVYYLYCPNGNTAASCPAANPVYVDSTENKCQNYLYDYRLKFVIKGENYWFPIGKAHMSNKPKDCS